MIRIRPFVANTVTCWNRRVSRPSLDSNLSSREINVNPTLQLINTTVQSNPRSSFNQFAPKIRLVLLLLRVLRRTRRYIVQNSTSLSFNNVLLLL
jgi:hypothetical protein